MAKGSLLRKRYTSQFCTKYYPFLLVAIVSVWVLKPIEKSQDADPLLLQNVEALASGEDSSQTHCYGRGSVDCPVSHDKVDVVYDSYSLGE